VDCVPVLREYFLHEGEVIGVVVNKQDVHGRTPAPMYFKCSILNSIWRNQPGIAVREVTNVMSEM
jgi:hypothetical protein